MIFLRKRREAKKFWAHNSRMESKMRDSLGSVPLYGLGGWTGLRMAGLWEFSDDGNAETVSLRHGDPRDVTAPNVLVAVTRADPAQVVKKLQFGHTLTDQLPDRDAVRAARPGSPAPAPVGECELLVEGRPRVFQLWQDSAGWQAACRLDDRCAIVLDAHRLSPAEATLVQIHDFETCLADRRTWIHKYFD
ncbi:hypothetical protein BS330_03440 [Amycolatopsis keratiniphila subsp. nogabecina]|nr:hypothetical protein BS330_03440 [Amycolatopsis keratiniphila subsp. nogabecina]SDU66102.1 hypothetical protein SAMN04489733_7876 [Amycolatopsis keratiniphila]